MNNITKFSEDKSPERIQPEELEVADTYIATEFSMKDTAEVLGIPIADVSDIIKRRPVKFYVNQVLGEVAYNNGFKLTKLLEKVIDKKMEELEEADIGSNKDIADLIKLAIEWTKVRSQLIKDERDSNVGKQTNVQINEYGEAGHYRGLMEKLLK